PLCGCFFVFQAVEDFRPRQEHGAGAREEQQIATPARELLQILRAARGRAQRQGIDNQESLEAGLDDNQPRDLAQHASIRSLTPAWAMTVAARRFRGEQW